MNFSMKSGSSKGYSIIIPKLSRILTINAIIKSKYTLYPSILLKVFSRLSNNIHTIVFG